MSEHSSIKSNSTYFDHKYMVKMVSFSGAYYGIYDPSQILQKLLSGEVDHSIEIGKLVDKSYKRVNDTDATVLVPIEVLLTMMFCTCFIGEEIGPNVEGASFHSPFPLCDCCWGRR